MLMSNTLQALMSLATHCRDLVTLECAGLHHLTGTQTLTNHDYVSSYSYTSQLLLLNIDDYITWC